MQSQVNIQTQTQRQLQQQHLSPQQLQVVKLLEMPLAELEQKVQSELDVNPSLEADSYDEGIYGDTATTGSDFGQDNGEDATANDDFARDEAERREDALNDALDSIGSDDRFEGSTYSDDYTPSSATEQKTVDNGNISSFIDTLYDQMSLETLDDTERQIMEYLIGSLDDDGLLRKDLLTISDELAIYNSLFVETDQIEQVLMKLQDFDPAGIGARSLQECLTIQIERMKATPLTMLMYRVINECYDDFTSNHWERICRTLNISEIQADELRYEIRHRLTPKPGASLGETQGRSLHQITPDIILSIDFDNNITFELNNGRIPKLHVVSEHEEMLQSMLRTRQKNNEAQPTEAIAFLQNNIDQASTFISAMQQRNETIVKTMTAIIRLQRRYLLSGDETDLRPMVLKDVAEMTGLDLSTISRVSRAKYVQTPWGTFRMRHFFSEAYTTKDGDTMSTKSIKLALRTVIEAENPKHPLSDDKLVSVMAERGFPIARRTIAKYREQMGIPVARLRKRL